MLLLVWSTFCNQFATRVFEKVTHESVIFVVFINVALYGIMSIVCASIARLPWFALDRGTCEAITPPKGFTRFRIWLGDGRFNRKETAAICFCGAAKGNTTGRSRHSIKLTSFRSCTGSTAHIDHVLGLPPRRPSRPDCPNLSLSRYYNTSYFMEPLV